jgi:hypothetical protein
MGAFTGFLSNPHCKHGVLNTFYTIYSSMLKPYKNKYNRPAILGKTFPLPFVTNLKVAKELGYDPSP